MESSQPPHRSAPRTVRATAQSLALLTLGGLLGGFVVAHNGVQAQVQRAVSLNTTAAVAPRSETDRLREAAIARASPAVVEVINVGVGLGSGVVMSKDGYIVTNDHVVSGGQTLQVALPDGATVAATLIGVDPVDDLAVIKIRSGGLTAATFGDSSRLIVGQSVLAIGNPLGQVSTVTDGIVSVLNRTVSEGQGTNGRIARAIQTSAAINPGNSGGALIDLAGQVIGIPTLTAVDPEFNTPANGVGFAIPSRRVEAIAPQLITFGHVVHSGLAALGISSNDVNSQQGALPSGSGVLIVQVVAGSAAARAGLQQGDVITGFNGHTVTNYGDLIGYLANQKPGDRVTLAVVTSSGAHRSYTLTLGELAIAAH